MPKPTNKDRAQLAADTLDAFQAAIGTDDEDAICDLLCDLMHYCDQTSFDFDSELARGIVHYKAELAEEK